MEMDYDVFVSYACEDRDEVVGPLVLALQECGLRVWWDKTALRVGDSLTETIDHGLAHSRRGIVVLSPAFFGKSWTRRELEGLVMRQMGGERVILPVWHRVSTAEVRAFSLPLANIVAVNTKEGLDAVAASILAAIDPATPSIPQAGGVPPRRWATTTLKFYGNFFLIAVSSTLIGCSYPLMSNNLPIKKEFIIILYLVVILAMMARLLRPSWTEFTERRNLDYRRDVMAALVFAFFLVILNSGIFLMLSTNLPIYSLFSDTDGMTSAIEWTFIINCSIATIAVAVYCFVLLRVLGLGAALRKGCRDLSAMEFHALAFLGAHERLFLARPVCRRAGLCHVCVYRALSVHHLLVGPAGIFASTQCS